MRRFAMTLAAGVIIAAIATPCSAQYVRRVRDDAGSMRFLVGIFSPNGGSDYWNDKFADFTGSISDFEDVSASMDYRFPVSEMSSMILGFGWYEGSSTQAYRDWVDGNGRDIRHLTTLSTFELNGAFVVEFGGRDHPLIPYAGLGGGYLWWDLEESGDFIDFSEPGLPVVGAYYTASSGTFELFALAGLEIRVSPGVSVVVQGRWREADDELDDDFAGFGTLELSGWEAAAGLSFQF